MFKSLSVAIIIILLIAFCSLGFAQVKIMAKPGEVFDLPEFGAIILMKDNTVKVEFVTPENSRIAEYKGIDIRKDDEILFFNGKKIISTGDMEKLYNETKISDIIKLGYKRDGKLGIIEFKKGDPANFPKRKMMKITTNADDPEGKTQEVEINGKKYKAKDGKVVIEGKEHKIEELIDEPEKTQSKKENKN